MAHAMTGALTDLKVLDLTSVVVGPICTWRLAQYGARVIKVEAPAGDLMRKLGGGSPTGEHSGTYLHMNRGKRNVALDLANPASRAIVDRLLAWADVVVSNMRPQALRRLALDAETIRARHPGIIHCLITGYGSDGPYAGLPAYDSVVQGAAGLSGLFLARDGTPAYVPLLLCDHVVGEIAAGAILAAALRSRTTGDGASIEVPMFETMAAFVLQEHLGRSSFDPPLGPVGDERLLNANNRPLRTADGWICITANTDSQTRAFLTAAGRSDLAEDPRFATVSDRARNVDAWFEARSSLLAGRLTAEWLILFARADVPAMPCHTPDTLTGDPHLAAVGLVKPEDHPTEGRVLGIRSSIAVDGNTLSGGHPAHPKGWDTMDVMQEIGFASDEIAALRDAGAVMTR